MIGGVCGPESLHVLFRFLCPLWHVQMGGDGKKKVEETTRTHTESHRFTADTHTCTQTHKLACFVLGKGDDVFVVAVDEFGEPADLVSAHADLVVLPFSTGDVLLERHQAPEHQQSRALANTSDPL